MIETSRDGPLKAMLIADPPGLGKTLISMMAVVKAMADARRFSIVAVPSSCMEQWCGEFEKFFVPVCLSHFVFNTHQTLTNRLQGSVRVLPVRDPTIQPTTMLKHDAIIVSYSFVMSQYRKALKYREKIARFKKDGAHPAPHRPDISIFSEIFSPDNNDVSSPFLVLDEAHAIKTECALTFAAIFELHEQCDNCLMLTGSPLDNTWKDVFAFLQFVKGHNLSAKHRMIRLLGNPSDNYQKWGPPKSQILS
jgi:SNF2 family DNA or RNA helicase